MLAAPETAAEAWVDRTAWGRLQGKVWALSVVCPVLAHGLGLCLLQRGERVWR